MPRVPCDDSGTLLLTRQGLTKAFTRLEEFAPPGDGCRRMLQADQLLIKSKMIEHVHRCSDLK